MKKAIVSKFTEGLATLKQRFIERNDSQNELHRGLKGVINDLASNMIALETVRQTVDPRMSKDAHILNVSKLATKLQGMTEEMRKAITLKSEETEKGMAAEMASRSGLKPGPYAAEIRQRFHAMTPGDRVKTIQGLIDSKDGASLDAILNSPPVLTGLLPQDIVTYREQFYTSACPELTKALTTYKDLAEHVLAAVATVETATKEYSDPKKLKDLEEREAASVAAQAKLGGGA